MSDDFQRLIDGSLDTRIRQVLGAALDDGPSPERIRSAAAALGLSAGAAASKPTIALIVLKWLGIGAVLGGVTATVSIAAFSIGTSITATPNAVTPARSVHPGPGHTAALRATNLSEPDTAPEPPQAGTEAALAVPVPSSDVAPGASVASFDAAPVDTLRDEIALLDQAHRALESNDAPAALAALDRYLNAPSKHTLATEALLLRVRALVLAGRTAEARALGQSYIARHPHDGYSARLRHLLGIRAPAGTASSAPPATKEPTASF